MEIALVIINAALLCGAWYFIGRNSVYRKLMEDYREALKLIGIQQAIIEKIYRLKGKSKETKEEDGEQD